MASVFFRDAALRGYPCSRLLYTPTYTGNVTSSSGSEEHMELKENCGREERWETGGQQKERGFLKSKCIKFMYKISNKNSVRILKVKVWVLFIWHLNNELLESIKNLFSILGM